MLPEMEEVGQGTRLGIVESDFTFSEYGFRSWCENVSSRSHSTKAVLARSIETPDASGRME